MTMAISMKISLTTDHHICHYPPPLKSTQVSAIVMGFREAIKEEEEREKEQLNDWRFDFSLWQYSIWSFQCSPELAHFDNKT